MCQIEEKNLQAFPDDVNDSPIFFNIDDPVKSREHPNRYNNFG